MEIKSPTVFSKPERKFLPENFKIDSWQAIEKYFKNLSERKITSFDELKKWMHDRSELEAVVSEDMAWRYIRMTCDTTNKEYADAYAFFVNEIEPNIAPYSDTFNKKLIQCEYTNKLDPSLYGVYIRAVKKALEIYREENIPLNTKLATEAQKYAVISGAMTINWEGEEITMQKAASFLKNTKREIRENVFRKIQERRNADTDKLNDLFTELIHLRHQVALNAGFKNYRDYKFAELGRFDYTVQDCFNFHASIKQEILPLLKEMNLERKKALKVEVLKPWDKDVDVLGRLPLKPFTDGKELIEKSIKCFSVIRKKYGEYLEIMKAMGHLDLESKKGKAPGGYNYPLYETGVPFIFMNAVGTHRDMVTMVHEGGHAIHSILTKDLEITDFKSLPSEVAELASMSMELISMEHWNEFFNNNEDFIRAKQEQLQDALQTLLWIAAVDKFQHWVYENPTHSVEERMSSWESIIKEFSDDTIDWSGFENERKRGWQAQLHIFEVPFYYIEYGMAQLGAFAVWKNYKTNAQKGLDNYEAALSLGYTKSIPEIYKTAGIEFNFSKEYVNKLAVFVKAELDQLGK